MERRCKYCCREILLHEICRNCTIKLKELDEKGLNETLPILTLPTYYKYDLEKEAFYTQLYKELTEAIPPRRSPLLSKTLVDQVLRDIHNTDHLIINGARGNNKSFTICAILMYHFIHLEEYSFIATRKYSAVAKGSIFEECIKAYSIFCDYGLQGCYQDHLINNILETKEATAILEYRGKQAVFGGTDNADAIKGKAARGKQIFKHVFHDEYLEEPKLNTSPLAPLQRMAYVNKINKTADRGTTQYLKTFKKIVIYAFNPDDPQDPMAIEFREKIPTGNCFYRKSKVELCEANEAYLELNPFIAKIESKEVVVEKLDENNEVMVNEKGEPLFEKKVVNTKYLHLSYLAAKPETRTPDFYTNKEKEKYDKPLVYRKDYLGAWIIDNENNMTYWGMKGEALYENIELNKMEIYGGLDPGLGDSTGLVIWGKHTYQNQSKYLILWCKEYSKIKNGVVLINSIIDDLKNDPFLKTLPPIDIYCDNKNGIYIDILNEYIDNNNIKNAYISKIKFLDRANEINARSDTFNALFQLDKILIGRTNNNSHIIENCELLLERFRNCKNDENNGKRDERPKKNILDLINASEYCLMNVISLFN